MNGFYQQEKPGNFSSLGFFFKYNICFNACFFSHRVHSEIARNILDEAQACLPPPHSVSHCQAKKTFWQAGLLLISWHTSCIILWTIKTKNKYMIKNNWCESSIPSWFTGQLITKCNRDLWKIWECFYFYYPVFLSFLFFYCYFAVIFLFFYVFVLIFVLCSFLWFHFSLL